MAAESQGYGTCGCRDFSIFFSNKASLVESLDEMVLLDPTRNTPTSCSTISMNRSGEKLVVRGHGSTLLRQESQDPPKCSASQVFYRLPQMDVIWDEELLQHPDSEDDLLLLLSEPVEYLVNNLATIVEHVEFIDPVTSSGDAHEAFASIHVDREERSLTDEGAFYSCKVSDCAVVEVFNKMPLPDVVWDQESQHSPKSHGLLLQLASVEEYFDVETMIPVDDQIISVANGPSLFLEHSVANTDQMSNEIPNEVVWDKESLYSLDSRGNYLQPYWVGMDNKPIAEPVSFKAPVAGELFDDNHVWDDDPQYDTEPPDDMSLDVDHVVEPLTKDFQVLPNVEGSANEMENLTEEIILVLYNDALWDDKVAGLSLIAAVFSKLGVPIKSQDHYLGNSFSEAFLNFDQTNFYVGWLAASS